MATLTALWERHYTAWNVFDFLILIIVVAACVGVTYVALEVFGVTIPAWVVKIFWIVVACVVAIMAIKFIASL